MIADQEREKIFHVSFQIFYYFRFLNFAFVSPPFGRGIKSEMEIEKFEMTNGKSLSSPRW